MSLNPSKRNTEGYVILYEYQEEQQPGTFSTLYMFKKVMKEEDILTELLILYRSRRIKVFQVFELGRPLKVKWI